jgi:hypothetical protein
MEYSIDAVLNRIVLKDMRVRTPKKDSNSVAPKKPIGVDKTSIGASKTYIEIITTDAVCCKLTRLPNELFTI